MTHLIYRAKLELVDSDRGLDRWQGDEWSSTVMDLERGSRRPLKPPLLCHVWAF